MKQIELRNAISKITDETKIKFSTGDNILSESFDRDDEIRMEEEDIPTALAYLIYSWLTNTLIFRGQKKATREKGISYFRKEWDIIVKNQEENVLQQAKVEEENALFLLQQYLLEGKQARMEELIAKLAPLAVLCLMKDRKGKEKEILKEFNKKKEIIFNQVVLFSRSLYHSFLKMEGMINDDIRPDYDNLGNGVFLYAERTLFIPTWQNAFTLSSFKNVLSKGLDTLSTNFPLSQIDSVAVIYLTKDVVAKYQF